MNVLVTGGTGFVGTEVVRQLRVSGHRAHVLARNPSLAGAQELAAQLGARLRPGNVLDPDSLRGVCSGIDAVIHLVGIISEAGDQTFERVHVHGTRNLVFAAQDAGVGRFLHVSALGTRPDAASRYHQSKWKAEELVRTSSLGWTVLRPSVIYGPRDRFVNLFARMIRCSPIVPVIGDGRTKLQPVPVKSVAAAAVKSLTDPRVIGETYELCGPEALTFDEVLDAIMAVLGRRRVKWHMPWGLARAQARCLEFVFGTMFRSASPLSRDQIVMLREDNVGDPTVADVVFGLHAPGFREGIGAYLKR